MKYSFIAYKRDWTDSICPTTAVVIQLSQTCMAGRYAMRHVSPCQGPADVVLGAEGIQCADANERVPICCYHSGS